MGTGCCTCPGAAVAVSLQNWGPSPIYRSPKRELRALPCGDLPVAVSQATVKSNRVLSLVSRADAGVIGRLIVVFNLSFSVHVT